jgi:AMMECR1 domain-containing protein
MQHHKEKFCLIIVFIFLLFLISCMHNDGSQTETTLFFSDRHVDSYQRIQEARDGGRPFTLILLGYHHDAGPGPDYRSSDIDEHSLTSFNWLGGLIETGTVNTIYWVSGHTLLLPNRNARKAWLERKIANDPLELAETKRNAIQLVDWPQLLTIEKEGFSGRLAISLDLDVLTVDPGPDPDLFLEEMLDFIERSNAEIITVALSAAYQPKPEDGWRWFARSYQRLGARWPAILDFGGTNVSAESREEYESWCQWAKQPNFINFGASFAPGIELWNHAPASVWKAFCQAGTIPGDDAAKRVLGDFDAELSRYQILREEVSPKQLENLSTYAEKSLCDALQASELPRWDQLYIPGIRQRGVAVRFVSGYEDRGCMSFYSGVDDYRKAVQLAALDAAFTDPRYESIQKNELSELEVELSIFGEFIPMEDPMNFIPGVDSLLLDANGERTLLQASLATERNLSRYQFLETLNRKAGFEPEYWKEHEVTVLKAPSMSLRRRLHTDRQKNSW